MLSKQTIKNALAFLERVPLTGKEAGHWCLMYAELQEELQRVTLRAALPQQPPVDNAHVAPGCEKFSE